MSSASKAAISSVRPEIDIRFCIVKSEMEMCKSIEQFRVLDRQVKKGKSRK